MPEKIGGSSPEETLANLKSRTADKAGLIGELEARRAGYMQKGQSSPLASFNAAQDVVERDIRTSKSVEEHQAMRRSRVDNKYGK